MLEIINYYMTLKQFRIFKVILAFSLAFAFSIALQKNNYWLACITLALGLGVSAYVKSKVKGVVADERDYEIGGKAARYTMVAFLIASAFAAFILSALSVKNALYGTVGSVIAFMACAFMLTYSFIFAYLNKGFSMRRKIFLIFFGLLMMLFLASGMVRTLSGEDSWVCEKGAWTKHGNPMQVMPTSTCEMK